MLKSIQEFFLAEQNAEHKRFLKSGMLQILSGLRDSTLNNELYHVVLQSSIQLHPSMVLAVIKLEGLILYNAFIIMVWRRGYLSLAFSLCPSPIHCK